MFRRFATRAALLTGKPHIFGLAAFVVVAWLVTGPIFAFSNSWQLFINSFTTITTFLMVFIIQSTQNRDAKAVQLKLDELIMATRGRNALVDLEDMTDEELAALDQEFRDIHDQLSTGKTMKQLHAKIEAESARRQQSQHR